MISKENQLDFFRVTIGTIVCLGIINIGKPDLFNVALNLGENGTVGLVPVITLILGIGVIFWAGYMFCVMCEVIIQVAMEKINALRNSPRKSPR